MSDQQDADALAERLCSHQPIDAEGPCEACQQAAWLVVARREVVARFFTEKDWR